MKPGITPERLYNGADLTQIKHMPMLQGIHSLLIELDDSLRNENSKLLMERDDALVKAIVDAKAYWRGVLGMLS